MTRNSLSVDLSGKVAIVTGAGGVMCSYFSRVLAEAGARVAMLDINQAAVQSTSESLSAEGFTVRAYRADVLDKTCLQQVHAQILEDLGPCSILINGAGGNHPDGNTEHEYFSKADLEAGLKTFYQLDLSGFQFVFDLNFVGTLLPTQVFSRDMMDLPDCSIINISSMNAIKPLTKLPAYSAAKAAISNFTEWLAVYFSKAGIRVNALAPGFFITNQNRPNLLTASGEYTARAHKILAGTPMGRFGRIEELSGALFFFVKRRSFFFCHGHSPSN